MAKNEALVDLLKRISGEKAQYHTGRPLRGCWAQKPWIVPILGTTKLHRLKENLDATVLELTASDLARNQQAAAEIQIEGERYPTHLLATMGRCPPAHAEGGLCQSPACLYIRGMTTT